MTIQCDLNENTVPPAWCVSRPYVIPLLFIGKDCWVYMEELFLRDLDNNVIK